LSRPRLKMQQDIRTLKQISFVGMIAPMSSPCLMKLGPRTAENRLSVVPHT